MEQPDIVILKFNLIMIVNERNKINVYALSYSFSIFAYLQSRHRDSKRMRIHRMHSGMRI